MRLQIKSINVAIFLYSCFSVSLVPIKFADRVIEKLTFLYQIKMLLIRSFVRHTDHLQWF